MECHGSQGFTWCLGVVICVKGGEIKHDDEYTEVSSGLANRKITGDLNESSFTPGCQRERAGGGSRAGIRGSLFFFFFFFLISAIGSAGDFVWTEGLQEPRQAHMADFVS